MTVARAIATLDAARARIVELERAAKEDAALIHSRTAQLHSLNARIAELETLQAETVANANYDSDTDSARIAELEADWELGTQAIARLQSERDRLRASLVASEAGAAALRAPLAIVVAVFEVRDRPGWCPRDMRDAIENAESALATDTGAAVLRVLRAAVAQAYKADSLRSVGVGLLGDSDFAQFAHVTNEAVAALPPALLGAK